jgi:hypothetical protein
MRPDLDEDAATDAASEVLANMARTYGPLIEHRQALPAVLSTAAQNYTRSGRRHTEVQELAYQRCAEIADWLASGRGCPFHGHRACPHGPFILSVLAEYIADPSDDPTRDAIAKESAEYRYTSNNNKSQRHMEHCYYWWTYWAFRYTMFDPLYGQPLAPGHGKASDAREPADALRWPVIRHIKLLAARNVLDGCSTEGACYIIRADQKFAVLMRDFKPDVYAYLEGRCP